MNIQELESNAKRGDIDACRELGVLYFEGVNGVVNLEKSAYYFSKAAEAGDVHSMYCMGLNYIEGSGVPRDSEKGTFWLEKAAESGNDYAMFELASHYSNGNIVKQNYTKALSYYEMAAQKGNVYAKINAARLYETGLGTEINTQKAKAYYQEAYNKLEAWANEDEDDMAQEWLGEMYYKGCPLIGVKQNYPQAVVWFEKAAEADNLSALVNLGLCFRFGIGTFVDAGKAIELNERAAAKNDTTAMCNLASMYHYGEGTEKNIKKAVELWAKAANLGDPIGQSCLGEAYMLGRGVAQDFTKALYWSRLAHEGGADGATDNLAILYLKGQGIGKNEKEAFRLFSEAAEKGNLHSRLSLAECYIEGWGTEVRMEKAYELLTSICEDEEEMREQAVSYVFDDHSVSNPFNEEDVAFYAKAYYLLGTLTYAGKDTDGTNASKAIAMLRMADRLGYHNDDAPEETAEKLISRIIETSEKKDIQDATDCYVEVREENDRGERYKVVIHHADESESLVNFKGRNKFIYMLALLIAHEGKSVYGLTTTHFSYMRGDLAEMAETSRINADSYINWIDEFLYAEKEEAYDHREEKNDETIGLCSLWPYRYSNAFSGANRAIKACCVSNDEFETFKLRSTGGKNAVTTMALDYSQIELPDSLAAYLDCLPTQKEIAGHKPPQSRKLPITVRE